MPFARRNTRTDDLILRNTYTDWSKNTRSLTNISQKFAKNAYLEE